MGRNGEGAVRQPRIKDNLSLGKSIAGLEVPGVRWESHVGQRQRLGSPEPECPAKKVALSQISFFSCVGEGGS